MSENHLKPSTVTEDMIVYRGVEIGMYKGLLKFYFKNNQLNYVVYELRDKHGSKMSNFSTQLFMLKSSMDFMRFLRKNQYDVGYWTADALQDADLILAKNGYIRKASGELEQLSEDTGFLLGWDNQKSIANQEWKLNNISKKYNISRLKYRSDIERTTLEVVFILHDHATESYKERIKHRNRITNLIEIRISANDELFNRIKKRTF